MIAQFRPYEESALQWLRRRLGRRSADAEDILQIVYIRIVKNRTGPLENPRAYLKKACKNGLMEYYRARKRARKSLNEFRGRPRFTPVDLDLKDLREDRRLKWLTEDELRVAWLIAVGFSCVEAAEYLGITPGAARARLHEARKRLEGRVA